MQTRPFASDERDFFQRLSRAGITLSVVYDIGASNGNWSAGVAGTLPGATFHLFEPLAAHLPAYATLLRDNLAKHRHFTLHEVALGERDGEAEFSFAPDGYSSSVHPMGDGAQRIRVPMRTLDAYAREHALPAPDVIKMDVQGSEDAILRGGTHALSHAGVVILETWLHRAYGQRTPLLTELVQQLWPFDLVLVDLATPYRDAQQRLTAVDAYFVRSSLLATLRERGQAFD